MVNASARTAVHEHSATESVVIPFDEFSVYAFASLAYSREHYRCPQYLINALGRVEISILPLPSRVRTAVTKVTAVWFYNNIHYQSFCENRSPRPSNGVFPFVRGYASLRAAAAAAFFSASY